MFKFILLLIAIILVVSTVTKAELCHPEKEYATCEWRGTAPICTATCYDWECTVERSRSGDPATDNGWNFCWFGLQKVKCCSGIKS